MSAKTATALSVNRNSHTATNTHNYLFGDLYARYRVERSYFGYDPSVLKSGFQKYARRAEVNKGLWCLVEMDLFSLLEWNGAALNAYLREYPEESHVNTKRSAQRLRTNMVNRMVVMMSEEVNISAWWMPAKILELYKNWYLCRGNESSRKYLVDMYLYLTSPEMIRLISDLKSVYLLPPYYVKPEHMNNLKNIHYNIQKRYPAIYADQTDVGHVTWALNAGKYPSKLQPCVDGIIYNLEKGSDHVFYWIRKLCDFEKQDGVPQYKYLKIVWEILHGFIDRNSEYEFVRDQVCALQELYKRMTHKEKPIYLYHAVLLIVRRNEIDWTSRPPQIDITSEDVDKIYNDHLGNGKIEMDNYVLDIHTRGFKRTSNSMQKFGLEGAFVKNENKKFLNKDYRKIYISLKKELDRYFSRGGKQQ